MALNLNHQQIQNDKFNFSPWNEEETLKYLVFLDENKIIMASKLKKKVFDQMSVFVKTRSSLQCRSHHQKATEKYKEIKNIIFHEKQQIQGIDYKHQFKIMRDQAKVKQDFQILALENHQTPNSSEAQKTEQKQNLVTQITSPPSTTIFQTPVNNYLGLLNPQYFDFYPIDQSFYYPGFYIIPQYQGM